MSSVRRVATVLLVLAPALVGRGAGAQGGSTSAAVSVSLRVLPHASFDGGVDHPLAAALVPGEALRVDPGSGVRTRVTFNAATRVVVTGTPLRGPDGTTVPVRFVCAFGVATTVSAAEPFDCVGGLVTALDGPRPTTVPLAIGAELSASATLDVPPGTYAGRVTVTATFPAY